MEVVHVAITCLFKCHRRSLPTYLSIALVSCLWPLIPSTTWSDYLDITTLRATENAPSPLPPDVGSFYYESSVSWCGQALLYSGWVYMFMWTYICIVWCKLLKPPKGFVAWMCCDSHKAVRQAAITYCQGAYIAGPQLWSNLPALRRY